VVYYRQDDPYILVDNVRVTQVLINLIQNSIKFSRANDTITVEIQKEEIHDQVHFQIKVSD
jgi:signal transduction histidine kinase